MERGGKDPNRSMGFALEAEPEPASYAGQLSSFAIVASDSWKVDLQTLGTLDVPRHAIPLEVCEVLSPSWSYHLYWLCLVKRIW